ncbi:hypothetical protein RhiJN_19077 [Ceratobasidium sp. AG-Ba]|nr:hypothetical protein RhiJN_19077 [Ceratobasidium sp. AG-Ba]
MSQRGEEFGKGPSRLTEDEERLMICQALIKCGDISNPTRPHAVSEHWSRVLLEEWACQATFEQELDLPVTVFNVDVADGAKQQAQGQVNFIDLFTQPLFNATASVIPQLHLITEQCARNRQLWQERMERLSASTPTAIPNPTRARAASQTQEAHYSTIFPLSRPPQLAQNMSQVATQPQTPGNQQTRPSSSGSTSTVGVPSLFSPTGSVSSTGASGGTAPVPKSFHKVSWSAPSPQPPPLPTVPSPLRER